jgi:hypothetical protein
MLLLVYGLIRAPIAGWGSARTIGVLAAAATLLAAFVANERRQRAPLAPLSIFRINGLGFSNVTQLVAFAGFLALFFYVTLYMQNVLGYSAIQTGLAYLPLCGIAVVSAGITSQLIGRVGTRPIMVAGAVIGAGGLYWLSRIPVGGSYTTDLLPGLLLVGLGIAGLFVAVATAANAGVPADKAGLAAALLNASQWLGGAVGLAIFTAVSTSHTNDLLAAGAPPSHAPHFWVPAGAAGRKHLRPRLRTDRPPRDKHPRRNRSAANRGGAGGLARSLKSAAEPKTRVTAQLFRAHALVAANLQHDLAMLPAGRDSLERRRGLREWKDRVDFHAKLAGVHERRQLRQLLAVRFDDEVDRARSLLCDRDHALGGVDLAATSVEDQIDRPALHDRRAGLSRKLDGDVPDPARAAGDQHALAPDESPVHEQCLPAGQTAHRQSRRLDVA